MQRQLDLLERVPLRQAPSIEAARSAGTTAGNHCLAKAEDVAKFDADGAAKFIVAWVRRYGPTSGESLVAAAIEHGYRAHDGRAFGPVFQRLIKANELKVLRSDLARAKGHGTSGGRLYGVVR